MVEGVTHDFAAAKDWLARTNLRSHEKGWVNINDISEQTESAINAALDAMLEKKCPMGSDCDLTAAYMCGQAKGNTFDFGRVLVWARDAGRKPAHMAFTAGPDRQAAYLIEAIEDSQRMQRDYAVARIMAAREIIVKIAAALVTQKDMMPYEKEDLKRYMPAWIRKGIKQESIILHGYGVELRRAYDTLRSITGDAVVPAPPDVLALFKAHVESIPLGDENRFNGKSTYNWGKHYLEVLKNILQVKEKPCAVK